MRIQIAQRRNMGNMGTDHDFTLESTAKPWSVPNFPKRALLAGSGGIALETFLSQPVEKWVRG